MEKLRQRQHQLTEAAQQCHGNTTVVDLDPSVYSSAFFMKSSRMQTELQSYIDAVSSLVKRLSDVTEQRAVVSRSRDDLSAWLETMNDDVRRLVSRPAKLHVVAAELEISHLEVKHVLLR